MILYLILFTLSVHLQLPLLSGKANHKEAKEILIKDPHGIKKGEVAITSEG